VNARVVVMVVDGLRADMVSTDYVPELASIALESRVFTQHHSVFPSATRINSASIATGCFPARHGLHGNAIALDEGDGLHAVSVGSAQFRERWRHATGHTLLTPTLSERLREHGGVVIHSNSSAGAAHMQDPDGHGTLYHRSGSHGPGFASITDGDHPQVGYNADGDRVVTDSFCAALINAPASAVNLLWICEPDQSQHALELGSAEHHKILAGADSCVRQVCEAVRTLRKREEQVLFIICSDHGHETVSEVVPVTRLLVEAGLKESEDSADLVLAASGMSALIYLAPAALSRRDAIAQWLENASWCEQVFVGAALTQVGLPGTDPALQIAFSMAKQDVPNRFGVRGLGAVVADPFSPTDSTSFGQHGGLGQYETNPMLMVSGPGVRVGRCDAASCVVDLAPTILQFLGQASQDMDGKPLLIT
jgi:arylsulfatase A-like enzyme